MKKCGCIRRVSHEHLGCFGGETFGWLSTRSCYKMTRKKDGAFPSNTGLASISQSFEITASTGHIGLQFSRNPSPILQKSFLDVTQSLCGSCPTARLGNCFWQRKQNTSRAFKDLRRHSGRTDHISCVVAAASVVLLMTPAILPTGPRGMGFCRHEQIFLVWFHFVFSDRGFFQGYATWIIPLCVWLKLQLYDRT